jgi:tRNA pseudouridine13 synthase
MQLRLYPLDMRNDFVFNSSPRDFTVEEIPLYDFSGEGEHLVVKIRKKELTTWELLDMLSSHLGIKRRDIGYAGLKDKHAMTIQHLSVPAEYEAALASFSHDKVKILHTTRHNNKIRIGHLKGNRFKMRLKKVLGVQKMKLDEALAWVERHGMPNYFGHQRFGTNGDNWLEGKALIEGNKRMRDRKTREFLIGAYQSYLFNAWLSERVKLSRLAEAFDAVQIAQLTGLSKEALEGVARQPHFFKLLRGDVMMHYPFGKLFYCEECDEEAALFAAKDRAPTGLVPGKKTKRAEDAARDIEAKFDEAIALQGARRYAWVWPWDVSSRYIEEKAHYELSFALPKGSYATVLLETLAGAEIFGNEVKV